MKLFLNDQNQQIKYGTIEVFIPPSHAVYKSSRVVSTRARSDPYPVCLW